MRTILSVGQRRVITLHDLRPGLLWYRRTQGSAPAVSGAMRGGSAGCRCSAVAINPGFRYWADSLRRVAAANFVHSYGSQWPGPRTVNLYCPDVGQGELPRLNVRGVAAVGRPTGTMESALVVKECQGKGFVGKNGSCGRETFLQNENLLSCAVVAY